jgi:hypothetical protein
LPVILASRMIARSSSSLVMDLASIRSCSGLLHVVRVRLAGSVDRLARSASR